MKPNTLGNTLFVDLFFTNFRFPNMISVLFSMTSTDYDAGCPPSSSKQICTNLLHGTQNKCAYCVEVATIPIQICAWTLSSNVDIMYFSATSPSYTIIPLIFVSGKSLSLSYIVLKQKKNPQENLVQPSNTKCIATRERRNRLIGKIKMSKDSIYQWN